MTVRTLEAKAEQMGERGRGIGSADRSDAAFIDDVIAFAESSRGADNEVEGRPVITAAELNGSGRGSGSGRERDRARVGRSICMRMDAISRGWEEMTYASPAIAPANSTPFPALLCSPLCSLAVALAVAAAATAAVGSVCVLSPQLLLLLVSLRRASVFTHSLSLLLLFLLLMYAAVCFPSVIFSLSQLFLFIPFFILFLSSIPPFLFFTPFISVSLPLLFFNSAVSVNFNSFPFSDLTPVLKSVLQLSTNP